MIELRMTAPPVMPPASVAETADFWGSAVPAWVGAGGSIIAGAVAAWALISDLRTRRGLTQTLAPQPDEPVATLGPDRGEAARLPDGPPPGVPPIDDWPEVLEGAQGEGVGDPGPAIPPREPVLKRSGIRAVRVGRGDYALVNVLSEPIAILEVLQAEGRNDIDVYRALPADLQPDEALEVHVSRSIASPAVIALDVTYGTLDWSSRRRVYLN